MAYGNETGSRDTKPITPTLSVFMAYYIGFTVVATMVFDMLGLRPNAGVSVAILMSAALAAAQGFARRHGRPPEGRELTHLVLWSLVASVAASILLLSISMMVSGATPSEMTDTLSVFVNSVGWQAALGGAAAILALHGLVLWIGYGPLCRFVFRQAQKKNG